MESLITLYDAVNTEKAILFSANTYNALFEMNKDDYTINFMGRFPDEDRLGYALHKKMIQYDNYIIFLPALANNISIYDIKKGEFKASYPINCSEKEYTADAIVDGEKIWIFPLYSDQRLICLDAVNFEYTYIENFIESIRFSLKKNSEEIILTRVSKYENYVIFGVYNTDAIVFYDTNKGEYTIEHTGIQNIFAAISVNNHIWVIPNDGCSLYLWDCVTKTCLEVPLKDIGDTVELHGKRPCNNIVTFKGKVILIPAFNDDIYVLDEDKKCFNKIGISFSFKDEKQDMVRCFGARIIDGKLWLFPLNSQEGIVINEDFSYEIVLYKNLDNDFLKKIDIEDMRRNNGIFFESNQIDLRDYIKLTIDSE